MELIDFLLPFILLYSPNTVIKYFYADIVMYVLVAILNDNDGFLLSLFVPLCAYTVITSIYFSIRSYFHTIIYSLVYFICICLYIYSFGHSFILFFKYSVLHSALCYSYLLFSSIIVCPILSYSILFCSILFYFVLSYSIHLFYSILFYSIHLFYSVLSYSILSYIISYSILSYSVLSYPISYSIHQFYPIFYSINYLV